MTKTQGPESIDREGAFDPPTNTYVRYVARTIDPDTGEIHTLEKMAALFHCRASDIRRWLGVSDIKHPPLPKVRQGEPPENERAFFLGLALGDFQIAPVQRGHQRFVTVSTESANLERRGLIKHTVGSWGEVHDRTYELKVYVGSPTFDFMVSPVIYAEFLEAKTRFAPFLLGTLAARLSKREDRLSLGDQEDLLGRIQRRFLGHFGFSLGNFNIEHRIAGNGRKGTDVPVITVNQPGEVFGALIKVGSVKTLPFLPKLASSYQGS